MSCVMKPHTCMSLFFAHSHHDPLLCPFSLATLLPPKVPSLLSWQRYVCKCGSAWKGKWPHVSHVFSLFSATLPTQCSHPVLLLYPPSQSRLYFHDIYICVRVLWRAVVLSSSRSQGLSLGGWACMAIVFAGWAILLASGWRFSQVRWMGFPCCLLC